METKHLTTSWLRVVALLVFATVLFAQEGVTVIGTVLYRNNTPAVNVYVSIAGKGRYTDVQGRYKLDGVPQGQHTMRIEQPGRTPVEISVDVRGPMARIDQTIP
jgi:hypothetical protein